MFIVNATSKVQNLMTDRGEIIKIMPGKESVMFIASENLIKGAIKLGNPNEIGVVISSSYELEIAKKISAAIPYLYTDLREAKAKLIDPSKDYTIKNTASNEVILRQQVLNVTNKNNELIKELAEVKQQLAAVSQSDQFNKLNDIIAEKTKLQETQNKRIKELETQLKTANENEQKARLDASEANTKLTETTKSLENAHIEVGQLKSQVAQYENDLKSMPSQDEIANNQKSLLEANSKVAELGKKIKELEAEIATYPSKDDIAANQLKIQQLDSQLQESNELVEKYKTSLKEASDTIESMKAEFNTACNKFNITKNESGEWIQVNE